MEPVLWFDEKPYSDTGSFVGRSISVEEPVASQKDRKEEVKYLVGTAGAAFTFEENGMFSLTQRLCQLTCAGVTLRDEDDNVRVFLLTSGHVLNAKGNKDTIDNTKKPIKERMQVAHLSGTDHLLTNLSRKRRDALMRAEVTKLTPLTDEQPAPGDASYNKEYEEACTYHHCIPVLSLSSLPPRQ